MPQISKTSPMILLILDGWGWSKTPIGNAIIQAKTPVLDVMKQEFPFALLQASGLGVGMDWGESGNSEIGHLTLGAGRTIEQYSLRINQSIKDQSFFTNPALVGAFAHATQNRSTVHLAGLLTSGSVHAAFEHIVALMELTTKNNQTAVLHLFLDGRDSGLQEGLELIKKLEEEITRDTTVRIGTVMGRDYAMDRNNNWQLTQTAYDLIVNAKGEKTNNFVETVEVRYAAGQSDPHLDPIVSSNYTGVHDGDSMIFFNFREDSMRQLSRSFVEKDPPGKEWFFPRKNLQNLYVAALTQYIDAPELHVAYDPPIVINSLVDVISAAGYNQLHIAESEKYAHVTYFFNGITTKEFPGETDIFLRSEKDPKEAPEMKVKEITDKVIEEMDRDFYEFIVINFANGDMLAHEGNLEAAILGVKKVDEMIFRLQEKILIKNGAMIITADHGNVESMTYKGSGAQETKHNPNPVPFYLIGDGFQQQKTPEKLQSEESDVNGLIADVAPTILDIMRIEKPAEMTGQSLLEQLGVKS